MNREPDLDLSPEPAQVSWLARIAPLIILIGGVSLSLAVAYGASISIRSEGQSLFDRRAERLDLDIQRRIRRPAFGLKGARGMYLASENVTRGEFKAYVESLEISKEYPGVLGFGFIERVMRSDLATFISREQADDAPDYKVHSEGNNDVMYIIKSIVPVKENEKAWGYDLGSEQRRREAVETAIATGEPTMTARLTLVQDPAERAGFLYLLPIYNKGSDPRSPEARQRDLLGLVYAPIVIEEAVDEIVKQKDNQLRFNIYDNTVPDNPEVLFDFDSYLSKGMGGEADPSREGGSFAASMKVNIGGRKWVIDIESTREFDSSLDRRTPFMIGSAGIVLSLLLAAVAWFLGHSRERALRMATLMTQDLALAKARADAANHSKSEFLANMSHEIRTPLTSILGYTNLLRDEGDLSKAPPERVNAITTIQSAGEHLLTVINDILDLSKIEVGRVMVERIDTPLVQLLMDIEGLMRLRAAEKSVVLRTNFDTPVPDRIISDPTRLRQILMNLVGNAVKFTNEGLIVLRVHVVKPGTSGARIRFEIEDTGPGMTEEQASRLFTPFTQADSSVTRRHGGTGLGLTISRRLAQVMGGDVRLDMSVPGQGSRFVFELPLQVASGAVFIDAIATEEGLAAVPIPKPAAKSIALSGRMLVAEDNVVNQRLIVFHLKKAGAEVDVTDNGREALELILRAEALSRPYSVLLTDMQMPEMDGYTLARTLRDRANDIPIIALTAHAMAEDRQRCLDAGCNDYVSKPIDKGLLIETCWRWTHGEGA